MTYKRSIFGLVALLAAGLFLVSCSAGPTAVEPPTVVPGSVDARPILIDTDMAPDDVMAILYLLQRRDISIRAITVSGTGETHCEPGVRNVLGLVALTGAGDIPVACGREKPLQGDTAFPSSWRAGADRIRGIKLPEGGKPSSLSAVDLIAQVIQSSPGKVAVLTLGPLTNLADAIQTRPEIAQNIAMIYIMGGAVDVPGNVNEQASAEWNIYVDPHAANIVLGSKAPVTLVPLDATNDVPITSRFYASLKERHAAPAADALYQMFSASTSMYTGGMYFWDPLTAVILTDESLASIETRQIRVVEEGEAETGRTLAADNGASIRVAVSADANRFEEIILRTLNGK